TNPNGLPFANVTGEVSTASGFPLLSNCRNQVLRKAPPRPGGPAQAPTKFPAASQPRTAPICLPDVFAAREKSLDRGISPFWNLLPHHPQTLPSSPEVSVQPAI